MPRNLLNKLAEEVILEIYAVNQSLQAVAQANKRLNRIALPVLYRSITLSTASHLDGFLELLIRSSNHGELVRSAWLGWTSHMLTITQRHEGPLTRSAILMDEDEDLSIEDMAELFDNVKMRPLPEDVISGIQEEQPWIKCLLILHLLPRLEEVRISSSTPRFERLLSQMMQHRLLSPNLRMVNRTATQGTVDADTLVPAFLYPSVTEIHGYHIVSNEMETQCEWLLPRGTTFASFFGTSNVERIELYASSLDTDVIEGLLQLPRALKTFLYSNSGTEHERMKLGFGEALAYTSDSLENLSVRWKETRGWAESDYTWTLHYFAGLKNVFISYRLMFGLRPKAADFTTEVFPSTLEVLGMFSSHREDELPEDEWEDQDYVHCFECLLLEKDLSTLPRLQMIAHLDNMQLLEPLVRTAADRGVHVALTQTDLESLPI